MQRITGLLAGVVACLALAFGASAVTAPPAHAVTCYGDYCSGVDPDSSGCSAGAITVATKTNPAFTMDLRWSATCKTNWTRITMYDTGLIGCTPAGTLSAVQSTGYTQSRYVDSACSVPTFTRWTPMIYSPVYQVRGRFTTPTTTYYTAWV